MTNKNGYFRVDFAKCLEVYKIPNEVFYCETELELYQVGEFAKLIRINNFRWEIKNRYG